jgi:hypothetical protein
VHLGLIAIDQTNRSVNQPGVRAEIQTIINQMMAGNFDGLVKFTFTFTTAFSLEKAFGLSQIVYGVILEFLAEPIRY